MHVHSAHHLDTSAAPQPFLSIELVSRSSRSSVHVCRFSDMLQSRAYCLTAATWSIREAFSRGWLRGRVKPRQRREELAR